MRKLILLLLLGVFLISGVYAESCNVARPYFGSVNCLESEWSSDVEVYDGQEWTCDTENCEIRDILPTDVTCTSIGTTSRLRVYNQYGTKIIDCSSIIAKLGDNCASAISTNKDLRKGDKISVDFSCNFGEPEGNPRILVKYKKLELFKNVDSASNIPIPNTEFCNFNSQWDEYSKQLPNNEILNSMTLSTNSEFSGGRGFSNIPSSEGSISSAPSQLGFMDAYWFIYDWVERPSLISGSFQNQDVWCNPLDHSLTELEQVNTKGNDCYLIPTTKLSTKVSCCSSDECKGQYKNQEIFCTDDFKCGFEKSCVSDSDCGSSERCQQENEAYFLVNSYCDKNELDEYGKGSCKVDKQEVLCCNGNDGGPSVCNSGEYCNYNEGCKEVTYETSEGKIKTGVAGINQENVENEGLSGQTSASTSKGSSTGMIILIIFLILIGGSIGFFVYVKNKKVKSKSSKNTEKTSHKSKCKKCGHPLKSNSKFCTKCGEKQS